MEKGKRGNLRLIQGTRGTVEPQVQNERAPAPIWLITLVVLVCSAIIGVLLCSAAWWIGTQLLEPSQMRLVTLESSATFGALTFGAMGLFYRYLEKLERERNGDFR